MPVPQRRSQAQISVKRIPALLIPELVVGNQHSLSLATCVLSLSKLASLKHPTLTRHHQRKQAPEGWSYREILEIVALPPPEGLQFWHAKVSQLAADLGMPSSAKGKDIVNFVLHVASVKKEMDRVAPLVKALAAAARVLEGRIPARTTLLPVVLALYPSAAPFSGMAAVGAESNAAWEGHHDEVESSLARELIDAQADGCLLDHIRVCAWRRK
jgi:hypothetical protein